MSQHLYNVAVNVTGVMLDANAKHCVLIMKLISGAFVRVLLIILRL